MRIEFYLSDDTGVFTLYGMKSNPFKVGDYIHLKVNEVSNKHELTKSVKKFNEKREKFHLKRVKLIKESKFVNINFIEDDEIIISYECKLMNDSDE
jgi:hypothetical protein